jgi:adenine-specific DNA-methyltransferase
LEKYSKITNECYLSNKNDLDMNLLKSIYTCLTTTISNNPPAAGIVSQLYAPKNDDDIQADERVFYTHSNAMYIDTMRALIDSVPYEYQKYFIAPLLAEASVHSNTAGVFKGFYKNKNGIGQFGGSGTNALHRIKGDILLPFPIFSNFNCDFKIFCEDSNSVITKTPEVDLAYLDPPYNQHPYGSNYFMLNLILENKYPGQTSKISGIPENWNRSAYNKKQFAYNTLNDLITNIKAKYVLISFNSEGFITLDEMKNMLAKIGKAEVLETKYNTFRACRNLSNRAIHVKEYLYLLEK